MKLIQQLIDMLRMWWAMKKSPDTPLTEDEFEALKRLIKDGKA